MGNDSGPDFGGDNLFPPSNITEEGGVRMIFFGLSPCPCSSSCVELNWIHLGSFLLQNVVVHLSLSAAEVSVSFGWLMPLFEISKPTVFLQIKIIIILLLVLLLLLFLYFYIIPFCFAGCDCPYLSSEGV